MNPLLSCFRKTECLQPSERDTPARNLLWIIRAKILQVSKEGYGPPGAGASLSAMLDVQEDRNLPGTQAHPTQEELWRFMTGELPRDKARKVVRHLLMECAVCSSVTRRIWNLGEKPLQHLPALPEVGVWR